jgi:hypothetical protein
MRIKKNFILLTDLENVCEASKMFQWLKMGNSNFNEFCIKFGLKPFNT